jgi:hypothetical protein
LEAYSNAHAYSHRLEAYSNAHAYSHRLEAYSNAHAYSHRLEAYSNACSRHRAGLRIRQACSAALSSRSRIDAQP